MRNKRLAKRHFDARANIGLFVPQPIIAMDIEPCPARLPKLRWIDLGRKMFKRFLCVSIALFSRLLPPI